MTAGEGVAISTAKFSGKISRCLIFASEQADAHLGLLTKRLQLDVFLGLLLAFCSLTLSAVLLVERER